MVSPRAPRKWRGISDRGPAVNGYRFWKDPLWWCACLAYAANRWIMSPALGGNFLRGQFDDLWLIPAALPVVLELQSWLKLRPAGAWPSNLEIGFHWLVWSVICEGIAPRFISHCVSDWRDVVAYGAGAAFAAIWWRFQEPVVA